MAFHTTVLAVLLAATAATPNLPRIRIMAGGDAPALLKQCSRPAPAPGEAWFRPTPAQIDLLERRVADANARLHGLQDLRRRYAVEAAGIVRKGHRYVYGSFVPRDMTPMKGPTIVCDGGPSLFGAELDVATGRIDGVQENGVL